MLEWKGIYDGVEIMTFAVMGCVVNGFGESKVVSIGISLLGIGEMPNCFVYIDGYYYMTLFGALASATYDVNQVVICAGTSFIYDSNGNLTSDGS